jgi:urease accessory protein
MNPLLLLLLDSRAPAGAHHHSAGMEAAITAGLVTGPADLEDFCRGRLRTAGRVGAAFAAAACRLHDHFPVRGVAGHQAQWSLLDAECEARTASEAAREASRQLGGGLRRLLRSLFPEADLTSPWSQCARPAPHLPLVLGAGVSLAGGSPLLAARASALSACASPASAAVRLLGLDPFAVQAMLARLAPAIEECARDAAAAAGPPASLPCDAAPALDLLADVHRTMEVRLFAS